MLNDAHKFRCKTRSWRPSCGLLYIPLANLAMPICCCPKKKNPPQQHNKPHLLHASVWMKHENLPFLVSVPFSKPFFLSRQCKLLWFCLPVWSATHIHSLYFILCVCLCVVVVTVVVPSLSSFLFLTAWIVGKRHSSLPWRFQNCSIIICIFFFYVCLLNSL